jgi:hypothetical protein
VRLLKQIAWIKSPIFGLLVAICGWIRFSWVNFWPSWLGHASWSWKVFEVGWCGWLWPAVRWMSPFWSWSCFPLSLGFLSAAQQAALEGHLYGISALLAVSTTGMIHSCLHSLLVL